MSGMVGGDGMKRQAALLAVLGILLALNCGQKKTGTGLDDDDCCPWCIGPDGGELEITDPDSRSYGVKITIPEGAWTECYALQIQDDFLDEPGFGPGFEAYHGYRTMFDVFAGGLPPDSLYMEITFPIHDIEQDAEHMLCAFYYEEDLGRWHVVPPTVVTDTTMTIHFELYKQKWSWGRIGIYEVNYDETLVPLLGDIHGQDQWALIVQELEELYDSVIQEDLVIDCASLHFVDTFFQAKRIEAAIDLIAFHDALGGACGTCNVLDPDFFQDYLMYGFLHFEAFLFDLYFVTTGPKLLIKVYGFMRICEIMAEIEDMSCDYGCFFGQADGEFYSDLLLYYVSYFVVEVIDFAIAAGYADCGP